MTVASGAARGAPAEAGAPCFNTSLANPRCGRLQSAMQRATADYDKSLRRKRRAAENAERYRCQSAPPRRRSQPGGAPQPRRSASRRPRAGLPPRQGQGEGDGVAPPLPEQALFAPPRAHFSAGIAGHPAGASGDCEGSTAPDGAQPARRSVAEWLLGGQQLTRQAAAHETFTQGLRRETECYARASGVRARETRTDTNTELRQRVRATERLCDRIERALRAAGAEHAVLGRVKHFTAELRSMLESGALATCELRLSLRDSRPARERVRDAPQAALEHERAGLRLACDRLESLTGSSDAQLQLLAQSLSHLHGELEDRAEALRVDEQCLVLDGSSSAKPALGGSAAAQPHLDIVLDWEARRVCEGDVSPRAVTPSRPPCDELLAESDKQVLRSVELRRRIKRSATDLDARARRDSRAVEEVLRRKVQQERGQLAALCDLKERLVRERAELEAQLQVVRKELDVRNKEKDIVCKRLRLRQQLPMRPGERDTVQEALEREFDALAAAVHEFSARMNHIMLENARMRETLEEVETEATSKRTALELDTECLEMAFTHRSDFPHALLSAICGPACGVYAVPCGPATQTNAEDGARESGKGASPPSSDAGEDWPEDWKKVVVMKASGMLPTEGFQVASALRKVTPHAEHERISRKALEKKRAEPPQSPRRRPVPDPFLPARTKLLVEVWKDSGSRGSPVPASRNAEGCKELHWDRFRTVLPHKQLQELQYGRVGRVDDGEASPPPP
eukprot:TRINITY_DN17473_c0_g1_i1.p1 TRINITY_DN17473_c0_g1~~TRINITY_DN17473_c0_g1_i1.p1  ORF type:complete len:762 (+),score=246.29 TRINITY_DN17473_c0_g1_i1:65-2287(+)